MSVSSLITHGMLGGTGAPAPPPLDTSSVLGNILDAAGQRLEGLSLKTATNVDLPVIRRFSFTPDWAREVGKPCLAYGPAGTLVPSAGGPIGPSWKDTFYPLTVRVLAHADREIAEQQVLYLSWIKYIRNSLERKRLGDYAQNCILQPGNLIEPEAAALNILSFLLVYQVQVREPAA